MSIAASQQGQLAVEPPVMSVTTASGELAVVHARVELRLSPKPMKGAVEVASGDPAFAIVQVRELRRAERWVMLEVSGAYDAAEPRAVKLTYTVDGRETTQTVTFSPAPAAPMPPAPTKESPEPVSRRYVPFEDDEPEIWPALMPAAPAPRREGSIEVTTAPALRLLGADVSDAVAAVVVAGIATLLFIFVLYIPIGAACGDADAYPAGTRCAQADAIADRAIDVFFFVAIPLYHVATFAMGRGIAYRLLDLRIVRRRALADPYPLEAELAALRPGIWRGSWRMVVAYAGAACVGIGYLWMFTNRERRTWHDLAAGTVVMRVRR